MVTVSPVSTFLLSLLVIMHPIPLNLAVERAGLGNAMINRAGLCMREIFLGDWRDRRLPIHHYRGTSIGRYFFGIFTNLAGLF
jgi:hypothetical protein